MQRLRAGFGQLKATEMALIIVVVVGYIVGVATAWEDLTPVEILVTFVMTAVYLGLARGAHSYFERYSSGFARAAYFAIQLTLVLLTTAILGLNSWLISLPLVALGVSYLSRWWQRWILYLAILVGLALPYAIEGEWQAAFYFALTLSPAIIFVIVFSRLVNAEQQARKEAEALTADLEDANRQLATYSTQVEELARTKERNRLAREIHDNLGHYLTVVNVQIRAAKAIMASDPDKAQEALDNAQRLTQDGLDAVRQSVATLRESPLGGRSLVEALEALAAETRNSGIMVDLTVIGEPVDLDPKMELTIYRAAQEGLTNVRKHARASRVDLTLDLTNISQICLTIADNGVGMTEPEESGYGLLGIQERVELLGGHMAVDSAPGTGFIMTLTLPFSQPAAARKTAVFEND